MGKNPAMLSEFIQRYESEKKTLGYCPGNWKWIGHQPSSRRSVSPYQVQQYDPLAKVYWLPSIHPAEVVTLLIKYSTIAPRQ